MPPTPKSTASLASKRSRISAPNETYVSGLVAESETYLRSSNGSRGTEGSARTDQASCQRLNMIEGRCGVASDVSLCATAYVTGSTSSKQAMAVATHLRV